NGARADAGHGYRVSLYHVGNFDGLRTVLNLLRTGAVVTPFHRYRVGVGADAERGGRFERYRKADDTIARGPLERGNAGFGVPTPDRVGRSNGWIGVHPCAKVTRRRGFRYGCTGS